MPDLIGRITAALVEQEISGREDLIGKINSNIKPPEPLTGEDVHIRAMHIVSDRVNSCGGCFPLDEHAGLVRMLVDSPVLIGHRKDSLPIARNFHAEMIKRGEANWIKVYFYWLKNSERGRDLQKNIDAGIYKEGSISFIYGFPECSICGEDIRRCEHRPFQSYVDSDGQEREAYFNYRQIEKVLETSLVYRGSVPDTSITNELEAAGPGKESAIEAQSDIELPVRYRVWDLNSLRKDTRYLVLPAYESLRGILVKDGKDTRLLDGRGEPFKEAKMAAFLEKMRLPEGDYVLEYRLIGFRGKERRPVSELIKFLKSEKSMVTRLEIRFCDLLGINGESILNLNPMGRRLGLEELFSEQENYLVPATGIEGEQLGQVMPRYCTRLGLEIVDGLSGEKFLFTHRKLMPLMVAGKKAGSSDRGHKCHGLRDGRRFEISHNLMVQHEGDENEVLEIEVSSLVHHDDQISLLHPRKADYYGAFQALDDIKKLTDGVDEKDEGVRYQLMTVNDDNLVLSISGRGVSKRFVIRKFSPVLLEAGRKFLADAAGDDWMAGGSCGSGVVREMDLHDSGGRMELMGVLTGRFALRPVRINRADRFLFYRIGVRREEPHLKDIGDNSLNIETGD